MRELKILAAVQDIYANVVTISIDPDGFIYAFDKDHSPIEIDINAVNAKLDVLKSEEDAKKQTQA